VPKVAEHISAPSNCFEFCAVHRSSSFSFLISI